MVTSLDYSVILFVFPFLCFLLSPLFLMLLVFTSSPSQYLHSCSSFSTFHNTLHPPSTFLIAPLPSHGWILVLIALHIFASIISATLSLLVFHLKLLLLHIPTPFLPFHVHGPYDTHRHAIILINLIILRRAPFVAFPSAFFL